MVAHRSWLGRAPASAIPFALVFAAGVSALGLAFGAWALAAVLVLAVVLAERVRGGAVSARRATATVALAGATLLIAALPTWLELHAVVAGRRAIASTSNSGNLHTPLRAIQLFGVWLSGSYKLAPAGAPLLATHVLVVVALGCALLGAAHVLRIRAHALAGWLALMLRGLARGHRVRDHVGRREDAGAHLAGRRAARVGGSRCAPDGSRRRGAARPSRALLALALVGGVLVSDALQYHSSNLAPTARYSELASLDSRFAGRGPTLFTDFDEYSLYELRDLDVGGPDFVYPPPRSRRAAGGHGDPVNLDRIAPGALLALPADRHPPRPARQPPAGGLPAAVAGRLLPGVGPPRGSARGRAARRAQRPAVDAVRADRQRRAPRADLRRAPDRGAGARAGQVPLVRASHPARWGRQRTGGVREGLVMSVPGTLSASFTLPSPGVWQVWVQGQIMPTVRLSVDGRRVASIAGQLDGNSLVPNTVPAGRDQAGRGAPPRLAHARRLQPCSRRRRAAVLDAIFLTRADTDPQGPLRSAMPSRWRALCGRSYQWVELSRSIGART